MHRLLSPFRLNSVLNIVFISNIFISFHYALVIYINSSFLSTFFSETQVSALYILGSIASTIFLLNASKILEKIGLYKFLLWSSILELITIAGMAFTDYQSLIAVWFLVHNVTISLILFNMDVLIETIESDKSNVGGVRATFLTITSIAIVLAPFSLSWVIDGNVYSNVYLLSSIMMLPIYFLINKFKTIETVKFHHIQIKQTLIEYVKDKNLTDIIISQFLLQLFYAFMVIYTPIYLDQYIGFTWAEIGIIFTIMLLPFVIFELPVGELSDDKYGEKEFLTIGFVIMGLSTIFMSFITLKVFWMWASILFISRIGASFVEISSESYFFKHTDKEKTDVISFFRIARPISFIVAPVLATIMLQFLPFQYIFIFIGITMLVGTKYSLNLQDTK